MGAGEESSLKKTLRWDGLFWRRLAYAAAVHGPGWFKRGAPPLVGAILFGLIGRNRRSVVRNLEPVLGRRGWWKDRAAGLRTFVEFARVFQETLESEGQGLRGADLADALGIDLDFQSRGGFDLEQLFAHDRGLVVLTSHFGCWEMGARVMQRLDRPVNLVMASEANETVDDFAVEKREQHGLRVIHSDRSLFSSVEMVRALRRGEIVAIQLDRSVPGQVTEEIDFFGRPAPFQLGPFMLAKLAGVPLWPVYVVRLGRRRFRFLPEPFHWIARDADREEVRRVMQAVVGRFEQNVLAYPHQWFQFHDVWDGGK